MEIVLNVVKEKIRKKMLYITTVLGILVVMIFSSDMGSLTIGGKNIKDYYVLIPILINVVNFLSGAIDTLSATLCIIRGCTFFIRIEIKKVPLVLIWRHDEII